MQKLSQIQSAARIFRGTLATLTLSSLSAVAVAAPTTPAPTYADVQKTVEANCLTCHDGESALGDVVLETPANLATFSTKAVAALEAGYMPAGDPEFKDTADGKLLISYFKSVAPATPTAPK